MGELIPLTPKSKPMGRSRKAPVMIDSDVEMRDAQESSPSTSDDSDSDSESSIDDGQIKDVEMPDAFPETSKSHQPPKPNASRHSQSNFTEPTKPTPAKPPQDSAGSPKKVKKSQEFGTEGFHKGDQQYMC